VLHERAPSGTPKLFLFSGIDQNVCEMAEKKYVISVRLPENIG